MKPRSRIGVTDVNYVLRVPIAGAVGGLLTWVLEQLFRGNDPHFNVFVDPFLSMFLGAGAAFIFVFVISNTDRSDVARLLAIALLAGFSFEPVFQAGQTLLMHGVDARAAENASAAAERAARLADNLLTAPENERSELLERMAAELQLAAKFSSQTDSYEARARVAALARPIELVLNLVQGVPQDRLEAAQRDAEAAQFEAIGRDEISPPMSVGDADRYLRDKLNTLDRDS